MKSFKSTAWILPQPVLIIGTYDKNGKPNAMNAATIPASSCGAWATRFPSSGNPRA